MKKIDGDYAKGILVGFLLCALFVIPLLVKDAVVIRVANIPNNQGAWYDILWWIGLAYLVIVVFLVKKKFTACIGIVEWISRKIWRDEDENTSDVESSTRQ